MEKGPVLFEQRLLHYGYRNRHLLPRRMPNTEESPFPCPVCKCRITLHEPFFNRAWFALSEFSVSTKLRLIPEGTLAARVRCRSPKLILFPNMLIMKSSIFVRQAKRIGPKDDTQPVRQPFAQKENSGLAPGSHIGSHVEKFMSCNWF